MCSIRFPESALSALPSPCNSPRKSFSEFPDTAVSGSIPNTPAASVLFLLFLLFLPFSVRPTFQPPFHTELTFLNKRLGALIFSECALAPLPRQPILCHVPHMTECDSSGVAHRRQSPHGLPVRRDVRNLVCLTSILIRLKSLPYVPPLFIALSRLQHSVFYRHPPSTPFYVFRTSSPFLYITYETVDLYHFLAFVYKLFTFYLFLCIEFLCPI